MKKESPDTGVPVWRKNPPTEPGLYWFQLRISDDYPPTGVTRHCRVVLFEGRLILHGDEAPVTTRHTVDHFQRWWAGPLPEPVEDLTWQDEDE